MADQIATASKRRLQEKVGRISDPDLAAVERAIRTQLDL
ncbi:MAG: type II toxin-antitoxin system PemK/MazF family toxin [Acidimicrobiia bacterium]